MGMETMTDAENIGNALWAIQEELEKLNERFALKQEGVTDGN